MLLLGNMGSPKVCDMKQPSIRITPDDSLEENQIVIPSSLMDDTAVIDALGFDTQVFVTDDSGIRLPQKAYDQLMERSRQWTFDFS